MKVLPIMNVLVVCEESQEVCKAFRAKGHNAFSCDLQPCSGGNPEWHIQGDGLKLLYNPIFTTATGVRYDFDKWDLVIAHPPCTYICNSGVRWLKGNPQRFELMLKAVQFFVNIQSYCEMEGIPYCIENPIPHKYAVNEFTGTRGIGKYTQIIQPYQFGHTETKATCLWLSGLPQLVDTNNVYKEMMQLPYADRAKVHYASPGVERAKLRSKTYSGIAKAMADQWG